MTKLSFHALQNWRRRSRLITITAEQRRYNHNNQHQDETLRWASQHRALAQACLEIPAVSPTMSCPTTATTLQSLEDYLTWRSWEIPPSAKTHATSLLSHVLSAPLTAATQLFPTFEKNTNSVRRKDKPILRMNWCCIGARAEASLPVEYWREILVLWAHHQQRQQPTSTSGRSTTLPPRLQATIDFVGPDILRRPPVHLSYQGHGLTLRWLYNGTFHEYLQRTVDPSSVAEDMVLVDENTWDAYILFNPGLGHANLRASWEPTLQLLLSASSTVGLTGNTARIVLTAHSRDDAVRDTHLLTNYLLPEAPLYRENPFASRIVYQDPLQDNHWVRPNHYAYTLVWQ